MKRLIVLFLAVMSLSGCATINQVIDYFDMARFDNNEYALVNSIRTQANLGAAKCGTPEVKNTVDNIYYKTVELKNYSQKSYGRSKNSLT